MGILADIIADLEASGDLIRVRETVDPDLVISAIQLHAYRHQSPAILFERVANTRYPVLCNLFGTMERSKRLLHRQWDTVQHAIQLKNDPILALKRPWAYARTGIRAFNSLPKKVKWDPNTFDQIQIQDLPLVKSWPMDGGAFITLPQVYSEDPLQSGVMHSNLGMYRVQLTGNDYIMNQEIGLHYQIHRGIGIHHTHANSINQPLKVSIFVGGHPAHTLSAVMPLPEGMSELTFAGLLSGRRYRYSYDDMGHMVSMDADFIITGEIVGDATKPEGPFGDHLGYYSLVHPFPVMKVVRVYARRDGAIFPITVVGRPPQEDTSFGNIIHELTGEAIPKEIPGIREVHAVDAAGVHPLLFAIGSERYTPYANHYRPAELLTQAHRVLGTGQLSLAKFLWITAPLPGEQLSSHHEASFITYILERIDWRRDVHFHTQTTIDTLDYSGESINEGSKVVLAAYGEPIRNLSQESIDMGRVQDYQTAIVSAGIIAVSSTAFTDYDSAITDFGHLEQFCLNHIGRERLLSYPLIIWCDDVSFMAADFANFLWATFTRANPSHDIYGIDSFTRFKHWGCKSSLVIDARIKPHHAPPLIMDAAAARTAQEIIDRYDI